MVASGAVCGDAFPGVVFFNVKNRLRIRRGEGAIVISYRSELLQLDIHFFSRILHICQRRMKSGSSATWVEENG